MKRIPEKYIYWLAALLAIAVLLFLGHKVTPASAVVLSWGEWQIFKVSQDYAREFGQLQSSVGVLASLLEMQPDPVRNQVVTDEILAGLQKGTPALEIERGLVRQAAGDVRDWSLGALERDVPLVSVRTAVAALDRETGEGPLTEAEITANPSRNPVPPLPSSWEELLP